jgi:DNA-binding LacI/PurR family transcriptional regulator
VLIMNIKDIAKMAGVSISTVSRVINGTAYVSPETKERVEEILKDTGYRPNSLAKELQQNKTNTIGVILPRIDLGTFANMFSGVMEVLTANNYNILLSNTGGLASEDIRYLNLLNEKRVDGILFFATGFIKEHQEVISKLRMPVAIVGQSGKFVNRQAIFLDSFAAAKAMVNYLISLGHTRIGCIAVDDYDENIGLQRKQGYIAALKEHNIPIDYDLIVIDDFEYDSGKRGAEALLSNKAKIPTAIFCITDRLAVSASAAVLQAGYKIPDDISIACIDDPPLLSFTYPPLTTMSFDYLEMGRRASKMLIDGIDSGVEEKEQVAMPYTLEVRQSTGGIYLH